MGSRWYTFWSTSSSPEKKEQLFSVDCVISLRYDELQAIKDSSELRFLVADYIEKAKLNDSQNNEMFNALCEGILNASDQEYNELLGYVCEFITDVDKEYTN